MAARSAPTGTSYDAVVVGLGPAGRALTHRLLAHGCRVLAIDPKPRRHWPHTLSGWRAQLPGWLGSRADGAVAANPLLRTGRDRPIRAEYVVLDNDALQAALSIDGADLREELIDDRELLRLARQSPVLVDARGAEPPGRVPPGGLASGGLASARSHGPQRPTSGRPSRPVPEQTAYGVMAEHDEVAALFGGSDGTQAVLMDWRPYHGGARWAGEPASFLYAIPMPDGRSLVEETCLVGRPGLSLRELHRRLLIRAERAGVDPAVLAAGQVERVAFPVMRTGHRLPGVFCFGAAGAQTNPFSGYSAFASLAAADELAQVVAATGALPGQGARSRRRVPGRPLSVPGRSLSVPGRLGSVSALIRGRDRPSLVQRRALRALLELSPDETLALFDAFARLPTQRQLAVLDPATPVPELVAGLTSQWWRMDLPGRGALIRATVGPAGQRGNTPEDGAAT